MKRSPDINAGGAELRQSKTLLPATLWRELRDFQQRRIKAQKKSDLSIALFYFLLN